jgi:hypothetical protein
MNWKKNIHLRLKLLLNSRVSESCTVQLEFFSTGLVRLLRALDLFNRQPSHDASKDIWWISRPRINKLSSSHMVRSRDDKCRSEGDATFGKYSPMHQCELIYYLRTVKNVHLPAVDRSGTKVRNNGLRRGFPLSTLQHYKFFTSQWSNCSCQEWQESCVSSATRKIPIATVYS